MSASRKIIKRYRKAISHVVPTSYPAVAILRGKRSIMKKPTKKLAIHSRNNPVTASFSGHPIGVIRHKCQLT
jgi:hypothetical protein